MKQLRLSILDQCPVPEGSTPAEALMNSLSLAKVADQLGYTRIWFSEHHGSSILACASPEILIARAAAETDHIRVGAGGIMLRHYSPMKVGELFRTLNALFPDRIDLGVGRSSGSDSTVALALRRNRIGEQIDDFGEQVAELRSFLTPNGFPFGHPFRQIHVVPDAPDSLELWLLGSSLRSAATAAAEGLGYVHAHFLSASETREAIRRYRQDFRPSTRLSAPTAMAAIGVTCGLDQWEAEHLHLSVRLMQIQLRDSVATPDHAKEELQRFLQASSDVAEVLDDKWPRYFVGTAKKVASRISEFADELHLDELLVITTTHSHHARMTSYSELAKAMKIC